MSQKIKILFPIDFSDHTGNSFPTAQFLAKTYDAEVFLLHVLEAPSGPLKLFSSFDEESARSKINKMMDEFIAKNGDENITFNKLIRIGGKPYKEIVKVANELSVNAIVMGTHGAEGMEELFVGTNASRVIRTAPCPVITIRNKPSHLGFKKILLPVDLTKETGEKLDLGIEFAQNFGASLVVLCIQETADEEAKKRLQKRMNRAVKHIQNNDVEVDSTLLVSKGNIADLVIEYGREVGADLICIMTQQELDFKQTFMGSNASHLVNHSRIPVMSIKPKREYRSHSYSGAHFG